jgi:hypothetical protein
MVELVVALQYTEIGLAVLIALALAAALWGPYLYEEIVRGKATVGGRFPAGTGDTHPGRRGDPAPGQPDAQPDPYETINQR